MTFNMHLLSIDCDISTAYMILIIPFNYILLTLDIESESIHHFIIYERK